MNSSDELSEKKIGRLITDHFEEIDPDPAFSSAMMDRVVSAGSKRGRNRRSRPAVGLAAVCAVVILFCVVMGGRHWAQNRVGAQYHPDDFAVVSMNNSVTCSASSALMVGSHLRGKFTLHTGKDGRVGVVTRRGTYIYLGPETEFAVTSRGVAHLSRGRIYCNNRGEIKLINTPVGKIYLLGTVLDANVTKSDRASITVMDGKVKLVNSHGAAIVTQGKRGVLMAQYAPDEGKPVNTQAETAWYDGRGQAQSHSGEFAYALSRDNYTTTEIWTMRADGTNKHRVRTFIGYAEPTSWVPGQEMMLVNTRFFKYSLLNLSTGQDSRLRLPEDLHVFGRPSISPNGKLVAFAGRIRHNRSIDETERGVFIYDMETGELRKLVDISHGNCSPPVWSPDGRHLMAAWDSKWTADMRNENTSELRVIDVVTGKDTDTEIRGLAPVYSPDGRTVAYCARTLQSNFPSGDPDKSAVFVADLKHGGRRWPITKLESGSFSPLWSPDGTRILFSRMREMSTTDSREFPLTTLHIVNADGSGERDIFRRQAYILWRAWSSDGSGIYVAVDDCRPNQKRPGPYGDLPTRDSILKIASDGSGIIADLGGNETDSHLSAEESRQTSAAVEQIKAANLLSTTASNLMEKGDFAKGRATYKEAADIIANIAWTYPLAGLSVDDLLHEAGNLDAQAARSDTQILDEECQSNMERVQTYMGAYVRTYGKLPDSLETLRENIIPILRRSGDYTEPRSAKTDAIFTRVFSCPGKTRREPVIYTFDARGQKSLKPDDILISCPNHPKNRLTPGKTLLRELNRH